jgi:NADH-quinone oxidoreductase subunit J
LTVALRDLFFYGVGAALLGLALLTVTARNLFRAALALLGVLWCTAMLFILLKAEMVALVQVMVYIGGIMIFVLYAVLLTSELGGKMARPSLLKVLGGLAASAAFLSMLLALSKRVSETTVDIVGPGAVPDPANIASLKVLGLRLLDPGAQGFLVPFELISILLLAAMVGAIAIARQGDGPQAGASQPSMPQVGASMGRAPQGSVPQSRAPQNGGRDGGLL